MVIKKLSLFLVVIFSFLSSPCVADDDDEDDADAVEVLFGLELANEAIELREGDTLKCVDEVYTKVGKSQNPPVVEKCRVDYKHLFYAHSSFFYYWMRLHRDIEYSSSSDRCAKQEVEIMRDIVDNHSSDLGDAETVAMMRHEVNAYAALFEDNHEQIRQECAELVNFYSKGTEVERLAYWQVLLAKAIYRSGDKALGEATLLQVIPILAFVPYENGAFRQYYTAYVYLSLASLYVEDNRIKDAIPYLRKSRETESFYNHREAVRLAYKILRKTGYRSINDYLSSVEQ